MKPFAATSRSHRSAARRRLAVFLLAGAGAAACSRGKAPDFQVQTATVERRDIVVEVEATGTIEPINVVEVKSKSSGQIVRMPVETGHLVKPGDLLVQLDTRDVRNQYDQAYADVRAADARLDVSSAQKRRSDTLYAQRVITAQEHETAALDYANAQAALVRARTNLDLAQQRLEDATVRAPIAGTVIEKLVSLGQVIASGTNALGGGTTLLKMADLNAVRARVLVTETDIGQVQAGQVARVTVDAYPNREFQGVVEKIEPQAVVQQSVTMFPVLVTLSNREGLLKPGMNGEVAVLVDRRDNVLAVPNDAVRNPREASAVAPALGISADSMQALMRAQFTGGNGGRPGANREAGQPAGGRRTIVSPGDVASEGAGESAPRAQRQLPDVTDEQCAAVRAAFTKNPDAPKALDDLRRRVQAGELDRQQMRAESQKVYAGLKLDPAVAAACRMRDRGGANTATTGSAGTKSSAAPARTVTSGGSAGPSPSRDDPMAGGDLGGLRRGRPALVFVRDSTGWVPRMVMVGIGNYDYTEVISGLREGETVALLASAAMQLQRQQQTDRMRNMGGVPGMTRTTPGGGGRSR